MSFSNLDLTSSVLTLSPPLSPPLEHNTGPLREVQGAPRPRVPGRSPADGAALLHERGVAGLRARGVKEEEEIEERTTLFCFFYPLHPLFVRCCNWTHFVFLSIK